MITLSELKKGEQAIVVLINENLLEAHESSLPKGELEKRLLEMGFFEGTPVTLLHEGPIRKDPIAILIRSCSTVAIRKKEAKSIVVRKI